MAADKVQTVKLLDKDCTVTIRESDATEKIVMKKDDYNAILDSMGVTKEVRSAVKTAQDKIVKEVLEFQANRLLTLNKGKKEDSKGYIKKSEIILGQGNGSIESEMVPHRVHTSVDPNDKTKKTEHHKYGATRITLNYAFAKEVKAKGGLLEDISDRFMKQFGVKK